MSLSSGKLNKRVEIQENVVGSPERNPLGQINYSWEEVATVWAAVEPLTGREFWAQEQVQSEITVRFRIRYRDDVVKGMRISYNGKIYSIESIIDPLEKHEQLQLMCSEGVRVV